MQLTKWKIFFLLFGLGVKAESSLSDNGVQHIHFIFLYISDMTRIDWKNIDKERIAVTRCAHSLTKFE